MTSLEDTAVAARRDLETAMGGGRSRASLELLRDLYAGYQSVPDIDFFLELAQQLFPCGCCGLASLYLQHVLGTGLIVHGCYRPSTLPLLAAGYQHTFLRVDDQIVDLTADQFLGPPVYVGPLREPWFDSWPVPR